MQKLTALAKRVRLVYRRSSQLTKVVVLCAIVLCMAALLTLHLTINATHARTEDLTDQAAQLEQENDQLEDKIDGLGSAEGIKDIAKDELGMVDPNETVITPNP